MKGFGIEVKNDLLDPKHVRNMGPAVWLYMWYLDKITAINDNEIGKVLGGQPVTFAVVEIDLGVSRRTYVDWVRLLLEAGYINTLRTPTGLVVTVNKAHKAFRKKGSKSDAQKSAQPIEKTRDAQKSAQPGSDAQKSVEGCAESVHPNKTCIPNGIHKTLQDLPKGKSVSPAVFDDGAPDPRNPQVQQVVEHFEHKIGHMPRSAYQRRAALTLLQRHGFERTIGGINAVAACRGEQFAPVISSLSALRDRWVDLETFYVRRSNIKPRVREIL